MTRQTAFGQHAVVIATDKDTLSDLGLATVIGRERQGDEAVQLHVPPLDGPTA